MMSNTCGWKLCGKVVKVFHTIRYFDLVGFCSMLCSDSYRDNAKVIQQEEESLKGKVHPDFRTGTSFTPPRRR